MPVLDRSICPGHPASRDFFSYNDVKSGEFFIAYDSALCGNFKKKKKKGKQTHPNPKKPQATTKTQTTLAIKTREGNK